MKQHVIIVAGGTGTRMRQSVAKQFIELKGLPLMWWTLRRFREALGDDLDVTLVLFPGLFEAFESLEKKHGPAGVSRVVAGGEERWHSVSNGLRALPGNGLVAVHDAVRERGVHLEVRRRHRLVLDAVRLLGVVEGGEGFLLCHDRGRECGDAYEYL